MGHLLFFLSFLFFLSAWVAWHECSCWMLAHALELPTLQACGTWIYFPCKSLLWYSNLTTQNSLSHLLFESDMAPPAHVFDHLVPMWWCCLGRVWVFRGWNATRGQASSCCIPGPTSHHSLLPFYGQNTTSWLPCQPVCLLHHSGLSHSFSCK